MADLDLLTEIHGDVRWMREKLSEHINEDKDYQAKEQKLKETILYPLWTAHQRGIGASNQKNLTAKIVTACLNLCAGAVGAIVAIKGLKP